eukprot:2752144-Prymnesium_polylepis.1
MVYCGANHGGRDLGPSGVVREARSLELLGEKARGVVGQNRHHQAHRRAQSALHILLVGR